MFSPDVVSDLNFSVTFLGHSVYIWPSCTQRCRPWSTTEESLNQIGLLSTFMMSKTQNNTQMTGLTCSCIFL